MLKAGTSKKTINLTEEMLPWPSAVHPMIRGIYSNCCVRAIVIDNGRTKAAFVSFDLGGVEFAEELKKRIERETGIPAGHIIMTATHNHTGAGIAPALCEEDRRGIEAYDAYVQDRGAEAVAEALGKMVNVRYGFGTGTSYINVNRDLPAGNDGWTQGPNFKGYSDRNVYLMKFVDEKDKMVAAIANYGMHATLGFVDVDKDGIKKSSGNIPGMACEYVEARSGEEAVVIWTSGAAGDQNPSLFAVKDWDEKDGFPVMYQWEPGFQYTLIRLVGKQHGVDILDGLDQINCYQKNMPIYFAEKVTELPTHRIADGRSEWDLNDLCNGLTRLAEGEHMAETVDGDTTLPMYQQNAVLGDIALIGVAAEIYSKIGQALHETSPYAKTMVLTHVNKSVGYILDQSSVDHRCFQYYSRVKPGSSDETIVNNSLELFEEILGQQ